MRHTFSAEFLKVTSPATNFGEAWELLCFTLLRAETADSSLLRLTPPDRGVDILRNSTGDAYQCKSSERGVFGTIDAEECISSLATALKAQDALGWRKYTLAINAPISGVGLGKINEYATAKNIERPALLPPDYWADLCKKYHTSIEHLFDYRVFLTEQDVLEALRKARYYDSVIDAAKLSLLTSPQRVTVSNNRTPLLLEMPFSSELSVEKLLDVAQALMGIKLDWTNYPDLGTSCGPSLSLTVDNISLPFKKKLSELTEDQRNRLQLWIKLVWKDELQKSDSNIDNLKALRSLEYLNRPSTRISHEKRRQETLLRTEALIQNAIWRTVVSIRSRADG